MSVYLYTLFVSLYETIEKNHAVTITIFNVDVSLVASAASLLAILIIFSAILKIKRGLKAAPFFQNKTVKIVFFYSLFAIILAYFVFRIYSAWNGFLPSLASDSNDYVQSFGSLKNQSGVPFITKIFSGLCLFLLKTFGNSFSPVYFLNTGLVVAGSLFAFYSVKFSFNCIAADFSLLFFALFADLGHLFTDCTGYCLLFFFVTFILYTVTFFMETVFNKIPIVSFIVTSVFVTITFFFRHFLFMELNLKFYLNDYLTYFSYVDYYPLYIIVAALILYFYFSYITSKADCISFGSVLLILIAFFEYFDYSGFDNSVYLIIFVGAAFGAGIGSLLYDGFNAMKENVSDENKKQEVKTLSEAEADFKEKTKTEKNTESEIEVLTVPKLTKTEVKEAGSKVIEPVNHVSSNIIHADSVMEKPEKPKFLDNPLPVPKKHVKKTFDYAFEPANDLMRYDIDVSDDDDFDIK